MALASEQWVSVAAAREARIRHSRHEAAAGLLAGLLSFAFGAVWSLSESSWQSAALEGIALALGASVSVWVQHVRSQPGELRAGLSVTAVGLLRFARAVTLLAALGTLLYFWD